MATSSKMLYLTRHAEAEHNKTGDDNIADAPLTDLGRKQAAQLRKDTEHSDWINEVELIVCSPLKRPMQTMLAGYGPLRDRLEQSGRPVIILPELEEVKNVPCDTGSSRLTLESDPEFAGLDFSLLDHKRSLHKERAWNAKEGFYHQDNVKERAKWVRRWLRERKEAKIVVVAHGDILGYVSQLSDDEEPWLNAQVRAYKFKHGDTDDEDAVLERVHESVAKPTESLEGEK
ncbi:hypothetical protein JCM11491_003213 [Sporobolomyces phaffii]